MILMMGLAKLIKIKSDDGLFEIKDDSTLGKEYFVDLKSIRVVKGFNTTQKVEWEKEIVNLIDENGSCGWMPTELLEIEGEADG